MRRHRTLLDASLAPTRRSHDLLKRAAIPVLLFVYGTLRRNAANHHEMRDARFIGRARTAPRYELVDMGGYPAILEGGRSAVVGELYEVDEALLRQLDAFEEVPELYERKRVTLDRADESMGTVEAYIMMRERAGVAARMLDGDWFARRQ